MKLLIHACCAPCLSGSRIPYEDEGFDVTALWYNPNIHPFMEYARRMDEVARYISLDSLDVIYIREYPLVPTLNLLSEPARGRSISEGRPMNEDERIERCSRCYLLRLERCAKEARERGFDAFTSTLLVSKYQKHDLVRKIAESVADDQRIEFEYRDLRKYWGKTLDRSRKYQLYRQNYCGCIYSEQERYIGEILGLNEDASVEKGSDPGKENGDEDQRQNRE